MDKLSPEERSKALKKWKGAGKTGQMASKCADASAAESERRPISDSSGVFAMMSTTCAADQGNLSVPETALDSDSNNSETNASGMAGASKD